MIPWDVTLESFCRQSHCTLHHPNQHIKEELALIRFAGKNGKRYALDHFREVRFYLVLTACCMQGSPERAPHSTQHTFATLINEIDGSMKDKAALMGHASYEMTMHYQHEGFEILRRIVGSTAQ